MTINDNFIFTLLNFMDGLILYDQK